jgi:hypothetical protein
MLGSPRVVHAETIEDCKYKGASTRDRRPVAQQTRRMKMQWGSKEPRCGEKKEEDLLLNLDTREPRWGTKGDGVSRRRELLRLEAEIQVSPRGNGCIQGTEGGSRGRRRHQHQRPKVTQIYLRSQRGQAIVSTAARVTSKLSSGKE